MACRFRKVALVISLLSVNGWAAKPVDCGNSIPQASHFAGFEVGKSTMEEIERRLGKGKECDGGHPRCGRVWRIAGTRWLFYADASAAGEGAHVDVISLECW